jgi:hypothetical protein
MTMSTQPLVPERSTVNRHLKSPDDRRRRQDVSSLMML